MDIMENYKIQESIRDVIRILDSAPLRPDMVFETNAVQLTNRMPIAHLAVERGLKSLLYRAGKTQKSVRKLGHSLNRLYRSLEQNDGESAEFLEEAFQDTAGFFGYNVNLKGFGHFRSLCDYLSKVGTNKHFEAMRYWVIEDPSEADNPIHFICPRTHREILCALNGLFWPPRETISERTEREVRQALGDVSHFVYGPEETNKKRSIERYIEWLNSHSNLRHALEEAVTREFVIDANNEFANELTRIAYKKLRQSQDPAVVYYIGTLSYLQRGSQRPPIDAEIRWLDEQERRGEVLTPAGTCLGFITWLPNSAWSIEPLESGLAGAKAVAWSRKDATHYLVNRLRREVRVDADATSKTLRLVTMGNNIIGSAIWTSDVNDLDEIYSLEFWDEEHGLRIGNRRRIEIPSDYSSRSVTALEGVVTAVSEQKVEIRGSTIIDLARRAET